MSSATKKLFRTIYDILMTAALLLAGGCLIFACLKIYASGEQPFSREAVAAAFLEIRIPVFFCLILIPLGIPVKYFFPRPTSPLAPDRTFVRLKQLQKTKDPSLAEESVIKAVKKEQNRRKLTFFLPLLLLLIGSLVFLLYALQPESFVLSDINGSVISAMLLLLPCLLPAFLSGLFAAYDRKKSALREIELLSGCPKKETPAENKTDVKCKSVIRILLILAALLLLLLGIFGKGFADVLTKAVNICTECIGLG